MAAFIDIVCVAKNNYANTETVTQNVSMINHIRPARATEISNFSTAVSAIIVQDINYYQPTFRTYLSAQSVAALKTAIAA
jgi:hypothetical protein